MRVVPAVLCVVVLGLAARAEAGGFFLMVPPMRVDVGALTASGDGVHMGTQIVAGVHLASVWPGDLPIDVGVGVVGGFIGDGGGSERIVGGGGAAGGGSGGGVAVGVFALGVYADVSHRDLDGPLGGLGVSPGVTLRVPFIIVDG